MLRPSLHILLFAAFTACSPIAIEDESDNQDTSDTLIIDDTPTDSTDHGGGEETPDEEDDDTALSVTEALALGDAIRYVEVKGYIVGHIRNNNYLFSCPTDRANTNFLLADHPYETRPDSCMPIGLNKGDEYQPELNLYDHPENFQLPIVVGGNTSTYFGKTGIRHILLYHWATTDSGNEVQPPGLDTTDIGIINGRNIPRP